MTDLYTPPGAELEDESPVEIPEEILKKIKNAWIAGVISIVFTVLVIYLSMSGTYMLGLDAYAFFDVALMVVFTFGIYKKSRVCAVLMLLFFLVNKILLWLDSGMTNGLAISIAFAWFYTMGVVGTFQYHALVKGNT